MDSIGFGLQGLLRSKPKNVACKADDNYKIIYKEMGNKRVVPFVWSTYHVMDSGGDVVVASGTSFFGFDITSYVNINATVVSGTQDGFVYVNKDTDNNVITLKSTGSNTVGVDLMWFLGEDPTNYVL